MSARETRGLETQEAGADMENVTLEKPNPGKFFCLPFNAHPEGKFPIRFFITSRSQMRYHEKSTNLSVSCKLYLYKIVQ